MAPHFASTDVVGLGENATDTILRVPRFPAFNTSMRINSAHVLAGGQVATAMVACDAWGLRARYLGKVGDDAAARFQMDEMRRTGVETVWSVAEKCNSQTAHILVDDSTGERTILFERDERLSHVIEEVPREAILSARAVLVDGHNAAVHAQVARWARSAGIPVVVDVDTVYTGHEQLLAAVDYLVGSHDLPQRITGVATLTEALHEVACRYSAPFVAATLGRDGVLAYEARIERFSYCPAFQIEPRDTTGAGDLFHAGFLFGVVRAWPLPQILDFSCAAAAMNCLELGARGGIRSFDETERFRQSQPRRPAPAAYAGYNVLGQ